MAFKGGNIWAKPLFDLITSIASSFSSISRLLLLQYLRRSLMAKVLLKSSLPLNSAFRVNPVASMRKATHD
jgi:hypothetical protein